MIKKSIKKLVEGSDLTCKESRETMREIMKGIATESQIASFLTALRIKGETVPEITTFAKVMKEQCRSIHPTVPGRLVDTCGTGGDRTKSFNISTIAAFVVAGAGVAIAKHGNRAVTSQSGSADALERIGLNLKMEPEKVQEAIEEVGIGFMYAPVFHPAMKHAVRPRREMGIRTIFNVLGPLTNPAGATAQLLGVYDAKLNEPLAYALKDLGCEEAMVVHGLNGMDEISTLGRTAISWLKNGEVERLEVTPKDFGVKKAIVQDVKVASAEESAKILYNILGDNLKAGNPKTDIVLVNAAAGIMVGGKADDFMEGMEAARESIISGAAYKKLEELIEFSGGELSKLEGMES
ncbi:anthranilate phosphoribosyltransferase [Candidatus Bathyarchaeota archaeon]|nr:anthranilate phosphoribosyltransferase [Candidatus Bathyarchaeota archaeon]